MLLMKLGQGARLSLAGGISALRSGDVNLAASTSAGDIDLRQAHRDLNERCRRLLTRPQARPEDLFVRRLTLDLAVGLDLFSIGAQGSTLARIAVQAWPLWKNRSVALAGITRLSELSLALVGEALAAFVERQPDRARAACDVADHLDALYLQQLDLWPGFPSRNLHPAESALVIVRAVGALSRAGDGARSIAEKALEPWLSGEGCAGIRREDNE